MLSITIISLVLIGLAIHRYLNNYWETGLLPYPSGYLTFANWFAVAYLISFVWMFGAIAGIIVALLCYFQLVYSAGLWIFSLPMLINMKRNLSIPEVNSFVYGSFSIIVIAVALLTVINFFISPYGSMWNVIGENIWSLIVIFVVICIIGNLARIIINSILNRM